MAKPRTPSWGGIAHDLFVIVVVSALVACGCLLRMLFDGLVWFVKRCFVLLGGRL